MKCCVVCSWVCRAQAAWTCYERFDVLLKIFFPIHRPKVCHVLLNGHEKHQLYTCVCNVKYVMYLHVFVGTFMLYASRTVKWDGLNQKTACLSPLSTHTLWQHFSGLRWEMIDAKWRAFHERKDVYSTVSLSCSQSGPHHQTCGVSGWRWWAGTGWCPGPKIGNQPRSGARACPPSHWNSRCNHEDTDAGAHLPITEHTHTHWEMN